MSEMIFVGGRQVGKTSLLRSVYRGGHYTGPKTASDWLPRGDCFYAVAARAGTHQYYLKWYETREEARKADETGELVCLRFEPVEAQREQTWLWVSFDLCNGHVGGGRYLWAFHPLVLPAWVGREVTEDRAYSNVGLLYDGVPDSYVPPSNIQDFYDRYIQ